MTARISFHFLRGWYTRLLPTGQISELISKSTDHIWEKGVLRGILNKIRINNRDFTQKWRNIIKTKFEQSFFFSSFHSQCQKSSLVQFSSEVLFLVQKSLDSDNQRYFWSVSKNLVQHPLNIPNWNTFWTEDGSKCEKVAVFGLWKSLNDRVRVFRLNPGSTAWNDKQFRSWWLVTGDWYKDNI